MNNAITKKELLCQAIRELKFICNEMNSLYSEKLDLLLQCFAITHFLVRLEVISLKKMELLQYICEKKLGFV